MIGRRRFGAVGVLAIPYSILFEVIAPLLQVAGVIIVFVLLLFDQIAWHYATAFLLGVSLTGQLQTGGAILVEGVGFGRYGVRDLVMIACWGPARGLLVSTPDGDLANLGNGAVSDRPTARLGDDPARRSARRGPSRDRADAAASLITNAPSRRWRQRGQRCRAGSNLKLLTMTSAGRPSVGKAPRKSHRFMRACSVPGFGTSEPRYVQVEGAAEELANLTAVRRQSNECVEEASGRWLILRRFPVRRYGWTTYRPFVTSSAFAQRLNSMSISRLLYAG
jgi:hypothetical protein